MVKVGGSASGMTRKMIHEAKVGEECSAAADAGAAF